MRKKLFDTFKRNEIYVVSIVIAVVVVASMAVVAWMLRNSILASPHEALAPQDLKALYATGYLRFREDDGTPYLKVEVHNGTLWWIRRVEFEFDGVGYSLSDPHAFRPLRFGALRCELKKAPTDTSVREYDLSIIRAFGYPPAKYKADEKARKLAAGESKTSSKD